MSRSGAGDGTGSGAATDAESFRRPHHRRSAGDDRPGPGRGATGADRAALPGLAVAALGLVLGSGIGGLGLAAVLVAAWAILPPVAVATVGAFLLVGASGSVSAVAIGVGLAAVLLGPLVRDAEEPVVATVAVAALAVLLVGVSTLALATTSLAVAAAALLALAGVASYAVHRYQLVVTGVVGALGEDAEVTTDG